MKKIKKNGGLPQKLISSLLLVSFLTCLICGGWSDGGRTAGTEVKADTVWSDGTYAIPVSFWNATGNAASMGNGALDQSGKLVVKNSQATLYLHLQSLSYVGMTGYLMQLDLLKNITLNQNQYPISYELLSGTVVSTYSVIDAYNAADSTDAICAGKSYPKVVSVPVTLDTEYIWGHIYVPVMGSLGFGDQLLRIKLDYSAVTEMTAEQLRTWAAYELSDKNDTEEDTETDTGMTSPVSVDKSKLKENLEAAKSLLTQTDVYTEATITGLKSAVTTARNVYDSTTVSQASVDTQVSTLQAAIEALVKKSTEALDKDNLKDGKYSVYVALWNASADQASMGNAAMNHTALLTVKSGIYTLAFSTHPMTVGTITACLQSMQIEQADGSYLAAKITAKNNTVDKEAMPSAFSFKLPSKEEYINVKIDPKVAVMGTDPLPARLKISWDTLKTVSDDATVEEDTETVTNGLNSPAVDLTDKATNVKISAAENILASGVSLKVSHLLSGSEYEAVKTGLAGYEDWFTLYDIMLYDADGLEVEPVGMVTVYLPLPENYDGNETAVYRFEGTAKTKLSAKAEDDYMVFQTGSLGKFAVVDTGKGQEAALETESAATAAAASGTASMGTAGAKKSTYAGKAASALSETADSDTAVGDLDISAAENSAQNEAEQESVLPKTQGEKEAENRLLTMFVLGVTLVGSALITTSVIGFILINGSLRRKQYHAKEKK